MREAAYQVGRNEGKDIVTIVKYFYGFILFLPFLLRTCLSMNKNCNSPSLFVALVLSYYSLLSILLNENL